MEKLDTLYFAWEQGPAVVESVPEGKLGFFIKGDSWMSASPAQVADFVLDGVQLSETEFNDRFGTIGGTLPDLPVG